MRSVWIRSGEMSEPHCWRWSREGIPFSLTLELFELRLKLNDLSGQLNDLRPKLNDLSGKLNDVPPELNDLSLEPNDLSLQLKEPSLGPIDLRLQLKRPGLGLIDLSAELITAVRGFLLPLVILCVAAWNYRHLHGIEAVLVMNSVRALRKEPQRHPVRVFHSLGSVDLFERNNRVAGSSLFSLYGVPCGRNVRGALRA